MFFPVSSVVLYHTTFDMEQPALRNLGNDSIIK